MKHLLFILIASVFVILFLSSCAAGSEEYTPALWTYKIIAEYPHDPGAFTQGLSYERSCPSPGSPCRDEFIESVGNFGRSSVRRVDLRTGEVLRKTKLPRNYFGEGSVRLGDEVLMLTWQGPTGFRFNASDLRKIGTFETGLRDGWGLTTDGRLLVASDGSEFLRFLESPSMRLVRSVRVVDGDRPIPWINELEWVDGEVLANVYQTGCVARIDPDSGRVKGWILLSGLRDRAATLAAAAGSRRLDVLNGIAWDPRTRRVFVTGKWWPVVFEIQMQPLYPAGGGTSATPLSADGAGSTLGQAAAEVADGNSTGRGTDASASWGSGEGDGRDLATGMGIGLESGLSRKPSNAELRRVRQSCFPPIDRVTLG